MRRTLFTVLSAIALVATGVVGAIAVGGTGTVDPPPKIAFLANGIVPADALAAGGIAGQLGAPLFTTPATSLNDDAKDGIVAYAPDLVIALGGPVAINDSVLTALSAATGLPIVATTAPDDGIVRVAGGDRFATARAVAGLLAAYDPAYLPVDATALGAIDADQVDGNDSTDFAASDQGCETGEVVTGVAGDGTLACTGLAPYTLVVDQFEQHFASASTMQFYRAAEGTFAVASPSGGRGIFGADTAMVIGGAGLPRTRLLDVTVCTPFNAASLEQLYIVVSETDSADEVHFETVAEPSGLTADGECASFPPEVDVVVDETQRLWVGFAMKQDSAALLNVHLHLEATADPLTPYDPAPRTARPELDHGIGLDG